MTVVLLRFGKALRTWKYKRFKVDPYTSPTFLKSLSNCLFACVCYCWQWRWRRLFLVSVAFGRPKNFQHWWHYSIYALGSVEIQNPHLGSCKPLQTLNLPSWCTCCGCAVRVILRYLWITERVGRFGENCPFWCNRYLTLRHISPETKTLFSYSQNLHKTFHIC